MDSILKAFHLDDPASLKRYITLIVSALGIIGLKIKMPEVDDNVLAMIAGLVAMWLKQSGDNSAAAKLATAQAAGDKAGAAVKTPEQADAALGAVQK
jgi:hypothetical protein